MIGLLAGDEAAHFDRFFEKLSNGGTVHMPLADYPFSRKFGWVEDGYGSSRGNYIQLD